MTVPSLCIPLGKANFPWYISKINKSAQPQLFPLALKPDDLAKSLRLAWNCSAVKGASQKCETEQNTGTSTSWNKVNKGMKGFWIDFALLHFSCSQRYAVIHLSMTIHKDYLCCIRIYLAVGLGANLAVVTRPAFLPAMIMLSSATFQGRQELAMWCFWMFLACFSLPSYRDGAAVRSGEPKSVSGNSVILGTKQRIWKFPHPNVRTSLSHCLYSPGYTGYIHLPYPTSSSWEMWIHCRCYGTWIFGVPWHPLYPLHHTFIPSSMFIHISTATSSISVILISVPQVTSSRRLNGLVVLVLMALGLQQTHG